MKKPISEIKNPLTETIVDLFQQHVDEIPNEIAVVFKDLKLTYNELNLLSNQLAHYLISEQDVIVGDLVGIMLGRSEMLIVCIMGILKAGAAYVPIDPEYPQQRISYIQDDCNCKFTFNQAALDNFLVSKAKYADNAPSTVSFNPNDLAYIIYTSGSTGNPKGVMIEHRNLLNYLLSVSHYIDTNSNNSGCFAHLSLSFDASITEIFLPLIFGKKLILSSGTGLEIFDDINLFNYAPFNFIKLTPSHISILISVINKEARPQLSNKYIIGGEALFNYHINQFRSSSIDAIIVNEYGPTEATVGCIIYEFNTFEATPSSESIPIGKPISNTQIYILGENRQLLPANEVGEIFIGGNGVARGYFNREDLTSEKFVPNPFDTDTRMYRTGDLAKWLPDGNLLYFGRLDEQVKINGHRIELGEIEAALIAIPQIKLASVILSKLDTSEPRLVAYLQPKDSNEKHPNVREELSKIVPSFMIPNIFMWVNDFPLTTNGKIDKKNLPIPEYFRPDSAPVLRKPRIEIEEKIAKVWGEILQVSDIGIDDNFFEMGGTSIMAVKVVAEIEKSTGKRFPLSVLFEYSTVEKFARLLNEGSQIYSDCIVPLKSNGNKVPLFMVHGGGLDVLYFANLSKHFDEDQPFYGIQGIGSNGFDDWHESIEAMAAHYIQAIVKINPDGPYAVAGYCVGGIVAFEMTRQLQELGKEVSLTLLVDSYADSSYYYKTHKQKKLIRYYHRTRRRLMFLKEMLTSWDGFKKRFNAKKEYLLKRQFDENNTMSELDALALERFVEATSMMHGILDKYHLKPQSLKVDLFRSKDHMDHQLAPTHLGWKKAASMGVTLHNIPADNFDMRIAPHDKILARMLQDILDKRHANI
ncbi:amino acid adenylation domain-containing protein [Flavobacterium franklandianum]|uniref:non-ribosomal peptide synthetase family protein n=1 Tax=Flavobacterium franklandianum TaxID=2594430 RepID=UPI00117BB37F|nr:amino acid adenylation domain-containing protein [Flavobacterium franklandianum]TRX27553.1 amino acid adenylation domain-containing protein [Flavobacterium franklandianum]